MSHLEQVEFCRRVKSIHPDYFDSSMVLDIGSLDINGSNRQLFTRSVYLGVDIDEGRNVDIVCKGHEVQLPDQSVDVIVSCECFEHDMFYQKTLKNVVRLLKAGGLFFFTCATIGRPEHGTRRTSPEDAPLLQSDEEWADYYKNLEESDIRAVLNIDEIFSSYKFEVNENSKDLYFWGIKKGNYITRDNYSSTIASESLERDLGDDRENKILIDELTNRLIELKEEYGVINAELEMAEHTINSINAEKQELIVSIDAIFERAECKNSSAFDVLNSSIAKMSKDNQSLKKTVNGVTLKLFDYFSIEIEKIVQQLNSSCLDTSKNIDSAKAKLLEQSTQLTEYISDKLESFDKSAAANVNAIHEQIFHETSSIKDLLEHTSGSALEYVSSSCEKIQEHLLKTESSVSQKLSNESESFKRIILEEADLLKEELSRYSELLKLFQSQFVEEFGLHKNGLIKESGILQSVILNETETLNKQLCKAIKEHSEELVENAEQNTGLLNNQISELNNALNNLIEKQTERLEKYLVERYDKLLFSFASLESKTSGNLDKLDGMEISAVDRHNQILNNAFPQLENQLSKTGFIVDEVLDITKGIKEDLAHERQARMESNKTQKELENKVSNLNELLSNKELEHNVLKEKLRVLTDNNTENEQINDELRRELEARVNELFEIKSGKLYKYFLAKKYKN